MPYITVFYYTITVLYLFKNKLFSLYWNNNLSFLVAKILLKKTKTKKNSNSNLHQVQSRHEESTCFAFCTCKANLLFVVSRVFFFHHFWHLTINPWIVSTYSIIKSRNMPFKIPFIIIISLFLYALEYRKKPHIIM